MKCPVHGRDFKIYLPFPSKGKVRVYLNRADLTLPTTSTSRETRTSTTPSPADERTCYVVVVYIYAMLLCAAESLTCPLNAHLVKQW